jgi:hypothetical protein
MDGTACPVRPDADRKNAPAKGRGVDSNRCCGLGRCDQKLMVTLLEQVLVPASQTR